jgi:pSer/pThr/pTyr-binding forkhead associated (FHA) protein
LVLDTGQDLTVVGPGRLGRAPTRPEDRTFTHVIALDDPEKSISKTHLEFGVTAGRLWVVDLDSTNGTRVFNLEGGVRQLKPGQRETVEPGETVQFGDRYFTVKDSP